MLAHLNLIVITIVGYHFCITIFVLPILSVLDEGMSTVLLTSLFYPVHEHVCTDCRLVSPNVHWKTSASSLASWSGKKWPILGMPGRLQPHFKYVRSLHAPGIFCPPPGRLNVPTLITSYTDPHMLHALMDWPWWQASSSFSLGSQVYTFDCSPAALCDSYFS